MLAVAPSAAHAEQRYALVLLGRDRQQLLRVAGAVRAVHAAAVRFVDDVRPYALAKTRLLNATHCALGPLGALALER